jgi:hypothetical protein
MSKTEVTKILSIQFSKYDTGHKGFLAASEFYNLVEDIIRINNPKRIITNHRQQSRWHDLKRRVS